MTDQTPQTDQTTAPVKTVTIEQRIAQYIKLRDMIADEDAKHKEKMKPAREALEQLNSLMLQHLNQIGGDSVKCQHGTVYKKTKSTASLEDGQAFMNFVIAHERWDLLDRKANVTAVKEFTEENGVLPPGVKLTTVLDVGVRRS